MIEKKTNKKTVQKKTSKTSSTRKPTTKKVVKKTKKEDKSLKILKVVFFLLIILVIVLSVFAVKKKKEFDDKLNANIVISIVNKEEDSAFSINLKALNKKGQYIFRVSNSRANDINTEDLNYKIYVQNKTDSKISLTKYGSSQDLITNQEETIIDCGQVPKNLKVSKYYVVKLTKAGKLDKKDMVNIKISATK